MFQDLDLFLCTHMIIIYTVTMEELGELVIQNKKQVEEITAFLVRILILVFPSPVYRVASWNVQRQVNFRVNVMPKELCWITLLERIV